MVFVACVTTAISYILYQTFAVEQYTFTAKNVASLVASTVDGDRVDDYFEEGTTSVDYADTMNKLRKITRKYCFDYANKLLQNF